MQSIFELPSGSEIFLGWGVILVMNAYMMLEVGAIGDTHIPSLDPKTPTERCCVWTSGYISQEKHAQPPIKTLKISLHPVLAQK